MSKENLYFDNEEYIDKNNKAFELLDEDELLFVKKLNSTGHKLEYVPLAQEMNRFFIETPKSHAIITTREIYSYEMFYTLVKKYCSFIKMRQSRFPDRIAIVLEKGIGQAVCVAGSVYGGAAYVPIEYESPEERIEYCFKISEAELIVTDQETKERLLQNSTILEEQMITYEEAVNAQITADYEPAVTTRKDVFAVIFTSGSSGKPKGVIISNGSIYNCLSFFINYHSLSSRDCMLSVSNICHDMSIFEIFVPLLAGGTVVMPDPDKSKDAGHWKELVEKYRVTFWSSVPTIFSMLLYAFETEGGKGQIPDSLKAAMLAGEVIPVSLYKRLSVVGPKVKLYGSGGPTETTLLNVIHPVTDEDAEGGYIPYGVPIWNSGYLILDDNLKVVKMGETGTIYNSGTCLANGYLDEGMTEEKFIMHPELKIRLYNTGDLGRYNEKGWVDILGRADNQVKINGKRIELEEIEKVIEQDEQIIKSVVSVYEDKLRGKQLAAQIMLSASQDDGNANVEHWKTVFDETYSEERTQNNSESDYSGWHSTYTGGQIPAEEMKEWVENTVSSIKKVAGKRILEIGCGTGLLLYRLAPDANEFVGMDLSNEAIETLKHDLEGNGLYRNVELYQAAADDLSKVEGRKFDTIIINSVIMFFPTVTYLLDVIKKCMSLLSEEGCLFLGDIQDYDLVKTFRTSVFLCREKDGTVGTIREKIKNDCLKLKDLYVSQHLFDVLHQFVPESGDITITQKNMQSVNEISKFRYDVVVYKKHVKAPENVIEYQFKDMHTFHQDLKQMKMEDGTLLKVWGIRNAMVYEDVAAEKYLNEAEDEETLEQFKERCSKKKQITHYPYEFYQMAKQIGCRCAVRKQDADTFCVLMSKDIITNRLEQATVLQPSMYVSKIEAEDNWDEIISVLRTRLQKVLPQYMVPVIWKKTDSIPRLQNGKIDRRKAAESIQILLEESAGECINQDESNLSLKEQLLAMWSRMLHGTNIKEEDSFFEIGGNSLLAMRFLSEINRKYHITIRFSEFYKNASIAAVEKLVHSRMKIENADEETFEVHPEDRYKEFPITGLQYSYLVGRQPDIPLGNCATHLYLELEIENPDTQRIKDVLHYMVNKHDAFRITISGDGMQRIERPDLDFEIEEDDFSMLRGTELENQLLCKRKNISEQLLDYTKAPLAVFSLTRKTIENYILHIYLDGLIIDGWSCQMFLNELDNLYSSGEDLNTCSCQNPVPKLSFRDYVGYLEQVKHTENYQRAKGFWMKKLQQCTGNPQLPMIAHPEEIKKIKNLKLSCPFIKERLNKLEEQAIQCHVSPFDVMLTAFAETLALYSRTQKFVINIPYTYRPDIAENIEYMLGECANFFLYDFERKRGETLRDTLLRVHEEIILLQDNIDYPGEEIVREKMKTAQSYGEQLSPVVFTSLLDVPYKKMKSFRQKYIDTHTSQIWIDAVVFRGDDDDCIFSWDCVEGLFDEAILRKMLDTYMSLIDMFTDDVESWERMQRPELVKEDRQILSAIKPDLEIAEELEPVTSIISRNLHTCRDKTALVTVQREYTYHEVEQMAGAFTKEAKKYKLLKGSRVAVIAGKSVNQVIAILSVVLNGGCYMPVEITYPAAIIAGILKQSEVQLIYADHENKEKAMEVASLAGGLAVIDIDEICVDEETDYQTELSFENEEEFCIIHSSGTTGQPKGMVIYQKGLSNCLFYLKDKLKITDLDVTIANTNYCHDLSIFQMFQPLMCGGKMAVPEEKYWMDPQYIQRLMHKAGVTLWLTVPTMMEIITDAPEAAPGKGMSKLRNIMLGGEGMNRKVPEKVWKYAEHANLYNVGGPAETTVLSVMHKVTREEAESGLIPYGKPIANNVYKILNDMYEECPIGVEGRMFVNGAGLVKGYIGLPELTAAKFVKQIQGQEVMYDTGDLGKINESGEMIFLGRNDNQVKLNGKRIELDGIESAVCTCPGVTSAIVKIGGNNQLMAYYVSDTELSEEDLLVHLKNNLPAYEIPYLFQQIESIPLTANGKKNRSMLKDIEAKENLAAIPSVDDEVSRKMIEICQSILNLEDLKPENNFFYLGGNSVHAIKVLSAVRREFGVSIELFELFQNPIILNWCNLIREAMKNAKSVDNDRLLAGASERKDRYLLSYSQQGILFKVLMKDDAEKFIVGTSEVSGNVNVDAMKYALSCVITCNDILSCHVEEDDSGDFVQTVNKDEKQEIEFVEAEEVTDEMIQGYTSQMTERKLESFHEKMYHFIFLHGSNRSVLILSLHHLVSDDETFGIIIDDVQTYYKSYLAGNRTEEPKKLQYQDYVNWQVTAYEEKLRKDDLDYWEEKLDVLRNEIPCKNIGNYTKIGTAKKYYQIPLSTEETDKLKEICANENITMYSCLVTIYALTTMIISEEKRIWVGMPVSNRCHMEDANVCGVFVNAVPLLIEVQENETLLSMMKRIFNDTLEVTKHAVLSFDYIVRKLGLNHDYANLPYNILVNYLGATGRKHSLGDVTFGKVDLIKNILSHNLGLLIEEEEDGGFQVAVSANPELFPEELVELSVDTFRLSVLDFLDNPYTNMDVYFDLD